ncbi:chemotaxis protein CheX [Oceanispirochaeta crateris]|uniref:Chemotaxis protein CheX n=1 Tax=Oceanispirochaeta crateris TaxID=2518645 RepID=A0A5C1QHN7_9SPIO|nr:chemotaxis protein CheX [Oceanispirochaeta crateris]QEN07027.1 chemotaxis protein CheX [Oceanispirochaeta crateris]
MVRTNMIKSKVLTFDTDMTVLPQLRKIFDANHLSGIRSVGDPSIIHIILDKNILLGAIFVNNRGNWKDLSVRIKEIRPELPLFLRVEEPSEADEIPTEMAWYFDGLFHINEEEKISQYLKTHIFIRDYPLEMIRHIQNFSIHSIKAMIPEAVVHSLPPLMIRDKVIYGEITSLIPVNTNWCRGYLMLQCDMRELHEILGTMKNPAFRGSIDEVVPPIISELTNLFWGSFKTVFLKEGFLEESGPDIQVPILVNHKLRNISFGGDIPQLCFEYIIKEPGGLKRQTRIVQKFIFNLSWNPNMAAEYDYQDLVEEGTIELF